MTKVDEYILELPKSKQEIVNYAREMILKSHPAVKESFKYKCPFYDYKKNLCYITVSKSNVIIGFVQGKTLAKTNPFLIGEQQQVRHFVINELTTEINERLLYTLQEAILLNDKLFKSSKKQWK